ncbi:MAG: FecR family protein [Thermodesulfobacteriota bacterium]|nr:FecR family protein [Thermodesulfobacteriota bacterium]
MKKVKTWAPVFWLLVLANIILTSANVQAQAARGAAGVSQEALPSSLKALDIKDHFIPVTGFAKAGVIHALVGNVVIVHRSTGAAYFGRVGDYIYENDSINSLAASRCRIKLFNDDIVTMAPESEFSVDLYQDHRKRGKKNSIFGMLKGKVRFYALRLLRYKETRFEVKTPTVVVGVRGTDFGVHVYPADEGDVVQRGLRVADKGSGMDMFLSDPDSRQSGKVYTDCFSEDGYLDVNGKIVGPGQLFMGKTGSVIQTPPEYVRAFNADIEIKTEEEKTGQRKEEAQDKDVTESLDEARQTELAHLSESQTDATAEQNTPEPSTESTMQGYFSGMLTHSFDGKVFLADVYASTSIQTFDEQRAFAASVSGLGGFLAVEGLHAENTYLVRIVTKGGSVNSGYLGTDYPINKALLGSNSHMEWGAWTMAVPWEYSSEESYFMDNKGYFIFGEKTPDVSVSSWSGTFNYGGPAYGTWWTDTGGIEMTGGFACQLDFGTGYISGFDMVVADTEETRLAGIEDASGHLGSSEFSISGGTWSLYDGYTAYTPDQTACNGSLYGPRAESIGGAWAMHESSHNIGAEGIFLGDEGQEWQIPSLPEVPVHTGYISALLTSDLNEYQLGDVFVTDFRQDFTSDKVSAPSIIAQGGVLDTTGFLHEIPYVIHMDTNGGMTHSGQLDPAVNPHPIETSFLGNNSHMAWGSWTMTMPINIDGFDYMFDNRGYYIYGENAPDLVIYALNGTFNYGGPAYGTWWTDTGGIDMTGGFACQLDFGTGYISDFDLVVADTEETKFAGIEDASGYLGSTEFSISGGTWSLYDGYTGYAPDHMACNGSLYGQWGESIGGAWGMYESSQNIGAEGIFLGEEGKDWEIPSLPEPPEEPVDQGYISALLTSIPAEHQLGDIFVTDFRQEFGPGIVSVPSIIAPGGVLDTTGFIQEIPYVIRMNTNGGATQSGILNPAVNPHPIESNALGSNSHMAWGSWTMTAPINIDSVDYIFDNMGYYIYGDLTPDLVVHSLSGTFNYGGPAYGTWWTDTGGIDMNGGFACQLDFGTGYISGFDMVVSDTEETKFTGIEDASGYLGSSEFSISGGTWSLYDGDTGYTPDHMACSGSLYGQGAESIGGVWGMYEGTNNIGAEGIFQGDQGQEWEIPSLPEPPEEPVNQGYISALLTSVPNEYQLGDIFVTDSRQEFGPGVAIAPSIIAPGGVLDTTGCFLEIPYVIGMDTNGGATQSGLFDPAVAPHPIESNVLGSNSHMAWGSWTMTTPINIDNVDYMFDNRGYYTCGEVTPDSVVHSLSGIFSYGGPAYGTWWTDTGGIDMNGGFACQLDLGTGYLSGFDMVVSDTEETKFAGIEDASGYLGSSEFSISGGTWSLYDGDIAYTPDQTACSGSLYGQGAESIGGVWGMYEGTNNIGAEGIFQGDQGQEWEIPSLPEPPQEPVNLGFYCGMLTADTGDGSELAGIYTSTSGQNLYEGPLSAGSVVDPENDYISTDAGFTYLSRILTDSGATDSGDLGTSHLIAKTTLGSTEHMEWGYWTMTQPPVTIGDIFGVTDYLIDNKGYFVIGEKTPDEAVASLNETFNYGGPAYGTWWTDTGGIDMTGGFECQLDFGTGYISGFDMVVSDTEETKFAGIQDASGYLGSSEFSISGGTWSLYDGYTGYTPDHMACNGSLYGQGAASLGGAWGMYEGTNNIGAEGIFLGEEGQEWEIPSLPEPPEEPVNQGYFSALLTRNSVELAGVYSSTSPQDFDSVPVVSGSVLSPEQDYLALDAASGLLIRVVTDSGATDSGDLGTDHSIGKTVLGQNEYMEWGYWNMTQPSVVIDEAHYVIDSKGYYVFGQSTSSAAVAGFSGTAAYDGDAWGTYFPSQGAVNIDMEGSFSCVVDFDASQVSDFDMSVSTDGPAGPFFSGPHSVSVMGAGGAISGSSFELSGGTWDVFNGGVHLDPNELSGTSCSGSFYGQGADYVGGSWAVVGQNADSAVGAFQGSKK